MEKVEPTLLFKMKKLNDKRANNQKSNIVRKKVYIAGKVGDLTDDAYYYEVLRKFAQRERELRKLGYSPVNPMTLVKRGTDWAEAMKVCVRALTFCDYISPLPDVQDSPGATIEINLAYSFRMTLVYPSKINRRITK